jgi:hypothetical protein
VRRFLTFGSAAGVAAAFGVAFAVDLLNMQNHLCTAPVVQPGLSDFCGAVKLGDRPSRAERLAWTSLKGGDCQALRAHVERFPAGVYRDDAADLISARRVSIEQQWAPADRLLAIYVGRDGSASPTEAAAKAAAVARATAQAERRCRDFAASGLFRFVAASSEPQEWICERAGAGFICGFDGRAVCSLSERRDIERESCGAPR